MSGRPAREQPKRPVQVTVDDDARRQLASQLTARRLPVRSLSQLFESLLFLLQSIYIEDDEAEFLRKMYRIESERLTAIARAGTEPRRVRLHLTLDVGACAFMDMLKRKHRRLFGTRSAVATALAFAASRLCADADSLRYLARRIRAVCRAHPTRHRGNSDTSA